MNNNHLHIGVLGENIVYKYLINHHFDIVARNVRYKCGELDFVALKSGVFHFIEVKSARVIRETSLLRVSPEENLTYKKILRLKRSIELYFHIHKLNQEGTSWQFDLYTVIISEETRMAKLQIYDDVIL